MRYRYVAVSRDGFVEQLVRYLNTGHYFYVLGQIPEHKEAECTDRKIIEKFGIDVPRWRRSRQKKAGTASVHYLRYGQTFILIATKGQHLFFEEHKSRREGDKDQVLDCRRVGISFGGYLIRHVEPLHGRRYTRVSIAPQAYRDLKAYLADVATHRSADELAREFRSVGFEPYRPVRDQLFGILREVNRRRKAAGVAPVPATCVRSKRRVTKPFDPQPTTVCQSERNRWQVAGLRQNC